MPLPAFLPAMLLTLPWILSALFGRTTRHWPLTRRMWVRGTVALGSMAAAVLFLEWADAAERPAAGPFYGAAATLLFGAAPAALAGVARDGWRAPGGGGLILGSAVLAGLVALVLLALFALVVSLAGATGGAGMIG